jgi:ABC-2 type transport system ATP-binding protein
MVETMTGAAAIDLHDVHKHFGPVEAVRGIDLRVGAGEVVAFLGPNGAGKTSTIDMILGLSVPTAGTVEVYGMAPRAAIRRGLVSAVMQTGGLLHDLTVAETVEYTARLFSTARPTAEVLERAGITAIATRLVGKCSGGEQQRLRFAMALLPDPALLILDEPTQGMDVEGRRDFWRAIRHDAAGGRTILFATHYLEEADAYADRVVLIRRGQVVADGTASYVKGLASGRTVRATLPGADASALEQLPGTTRVELRGDTVLLRTSDSDAAARYLLTQTPARDLEVTAAGLEEAFLALTSETFAEEAGGVAAGGIAAGGVSAGGVSAGGVSAGGVAAGGVAAGGVKAGGVAAGKASAGGDTAGGSSPAPAAAGPPTGGRQ